VIRLCSLPTDFQLNPYGRDPLRGQYVAVYADDFDGERDGDFLRRIAPLLPYHVHPVYLVRVCDDDDGMLGFVAPATKARMQAGHVEDRVTRGNNNNVCRWFLVSKHKISAYESKELCTRPQRMFDCAGCDDIDDVPGWCEGRKEGLGRLLLEHDYDEAHAPEHTDTAARDWFEDINTTPATRLADVEVVSWRVASGVFTRAGGGGRRHWCAVSLSDARLDEVQEVIASAAKTRSVRHHTRKRLCPVCAFSGTTYKGLRYPCHRISDIRARQGTQCQVFMHRDLADAGLEALGASLTPNQKFQLGAALGISGHRVVIPSIGERASLLVSLPWGFQGEDLVVDVCRLRQRHSFTAGRARLMDLVRLNNARYLLYEAERLAALNTKWWGMYHIALLTAKKAYVRGGFGASWRIDKMKISGDSFELEPENGWGSFTLHTPSDAVAQGGYGHIDYVRRMLDRATG
jgi:hypothetical protein